MNKTKILLKMVALAVVGAVMSGCAEEIEVLQPANQRVVQKTTISLADDATTRGAIAADGSTSFSKGDQIAVIYQNTNGKTVKAESAKLTDADLTDEGASATFTVELVSPKAGTKVRFIYPASMAAATIAEDTAPDDDLTISTAGLATQDGTLETIASDLGLAVYDGTMSTTATLPTGTGVELKNQLAILKLQSIKDDGDTEIRSQITDLTVIVGTNTYTITRTAADAPIYVAILPVTGNITITANASGLDYSKTTESSKTLAKNKIYPVNLSMNFDTKSTPLTIEAIEAGAQVNFDINTDVATNGVQYRTFSTASGWSDWADYTDNDPITLTSIGDKVQFRGDNEKYGSYPESNIQFDKDCYAYGNIMSLINSTDFITETTLTGSYNFCKLFYNNTHLKSHADKPLMLPATTLTNYCYSTMFCGCTSLTIAPKLPAMEMKKSCYGNMFRSCHSLIAVPDLPATTLAEYCYANMFQGCTKLVTALKLPATTLAEGCYNLMFDECSKLATVPADMLPATTLAEYCYLQMFLGCTSLTTAPDLPATTLAKDCYCGMFGTCESLTTAPELRATTLTPGCYSGMFSSCSSLTTAPELRAATLAPGCYSSMFSYCESLTTAPELRATTLAPGCYGRMFYDCTKLSSVTCLATNISAEECLDFWLYQAGTDDGCGRVVYVDPSMLTVGTGNEPGKWNLDNSGEDGKRWTLAAANRYPLAAANAEAIDLGKVIASDGKIYPNKATVEAAGKTGVAMIVYVGDPGTADASSTTYKGLAIALTDVPGTFIWGPGLETGLTKYSTWCSSPALATDANTDMAGIQNTTTMNGIENPFQRVYAAKAAAEYGVAAPTGTSGWFLPSAGQWYKFLNGMCGLTMTDWASTTGTVSDNFNTVNAKFTTAGYDTSDAKLGNLYWSSSEYSSDYAVGFVIYSSIGMFVNKYPYVNNFHVRPFLAF